MSDIRSFFRPAKGSTTPKDPPPSSNTKKRKAADAGLDATTTSPKQKDDVTSPPKKKAKVSESPVDKAKRVEKSEAMEIEKKVIHNNNSEEHDDNETNTKVTPTKKAYIKKKVTPTKSPKDGVKTPSSGEKKSKPEPKTPIVELDDDIEEVSPPVNSRKSKSPIHKQTPPKTEEKTEHKNEHKIEHKSPTATTAASEAKKPPMARGKSNYMQYMNKPTPPNKGAKELPQGKANCLAGKVFIITGVLDSLEREEAEALISQYGGSTVKSVAKKTTHALVGIEPGQSKMKKIEEQNIAIIDEDGLFAMIRDLPAGKESHVTPKKSPKKPSLPVTPAPVKSEGGAVNKAARGPTELWTDKYKPTGVKDLVANPGPIAQLTEWLKGWDWERRKERTEGDGKKKAAGAPRAVLISGPPGIGKTTAAVLVARSLGYEPIVTNASDTRNKGSLAPLLEGSATSKSITQFFSSKDKKPAQNQHKTLLIMDEIDGMSSGDRGGIAEVIRSIHGTKIPFICVCNDRYSQKLKSLANHCLDLRFRRPTTQQMYPRLKAICDQEGFKLDEITLKKIIESTNGDMRQCLNLLMLWSVDGQSINPSNVKDLLTATGKNIDLGPFDVVPKLFAVNYQESLGDRLNHYFVDSGIVPLMVQDNYLRIPGNSVQHLENVAAAADAISEGDVVEKLLRRDQAWELAPFHGLLSSVLPAARMRSSLHQRIEFPAWMGKNSSQSKYLRLLADLQIHSYLKTQASRDQLCCEYLQMFRTHLTKPLMEQGEEGIDSVIQFMDQYFINREDRDTILDLTQFAAKDDPNKQIPTQVKSKFTRKYNAESHAMAVPPTASKKKKVIGLTGDEPVVNEEDNIDEEEQPEEERIEDDQLVKIKKKAAPAAAAKKAPAKSKAKK